MRHPLICLAIKEKRLLRFTYDFKSRVVEPHAYGETDDGNELLRGWQQAPLPADWRTFRLDKAVGLSIADARFLKPRPDYKRDDTAMHRVFCQL
jgi:predicted DNA-binding transcriptional regulator YafY